MQRFIQMYKVNRTSGLMLMFKGSQLDIRFRKKTCRTGVCVLRSGSDLSKNTLHIRRVIMHVVNKRNAHVYGTRTCCARTRTRVSTVQTIFLTYKEIRTRKNGTVGIHHFPPGHTQSTRTSGRENESIRNAEPRPRDDGRSRRVCGTSPPQQQHPHINHRVNNWLPAKNKREPVRSPAMQFAWASTARDRQTPEK